MKMKYFNFFATMLMMFIIIGLTACNDSDEDEPKDESNDIVGTWKFKSFRGLNDYGIFIDESGEDYVQFKNDGTYIAVSVYTWKKHKEVDIDRGKYTIFNDGLIMIFDEDVVKDKNEIKFSIEGGTLTLSHDLIIENAESTYSTVWTCTLDSEIEKYLKDEDEEIKVNGDIIGTWESNFFYLESENIKYKCKSYIKFKKDGTYVTISLVYYNQKEFEMIKQIDPSFKNPDAQVDYGRFSVSGDKLTTVDGNNEKGVATFDINGRTMKISSTDEDDSISLSYTRVPNCTMQEYLREASLQNRI